MLIEFIMSFVWLAVAFTLSTLVMISEFRRIDCAHHLFESTRAELERRGLREMRSDTNPFPQSLPDFNLMNPVNYRETRENLMGTARCIGTSAVEKVVLRKLPLKIPVNTPVNTNDETPQ